MLAARAARCFTLPLTAFVTTLERASTRHVATKQSWLAFRVQKYSSDTQRHFLRRQIGKTKTLRETVIAPAGETAFQVGRGFLAGASVLGIGALCYYGLGLSKEIGAIDRSVAWSQEVRQRIQDTYMYFGGGLAITAASALAISRSPAMLSLVMRNSWMTLAGTLAAMIGSGMVVRALPYKEGIGAKQLAWIVHAGILGAVVAPLCLLGGPLITRAAWYTAGVVGGLSMVAMCAPSEKFLYMGGPLAIGLGIVFASSIGTFFLPPTTALGAGLYSISLYGGLVLFGLFLLYDTQRIIKAAETYPSYGAHPYDPVNMSIGIYLDTINIFMRIAIILAGGGNRRK